MPTPPPRADVIIVGAGVAGLSAAWMLLRSGPRNLAILESAPRSGGIVASQSWEGFLFERGADSFLRHKTAALELCRDLDLEDDLIPTLPAPPGARIWFEGKLEPVPAGWRMIEPTQLEPCLRSPFFSPAERADLAGHWPGKEIPVGADDRDDLSVADYLRRRHGPLAGNAIARRLAGPMLAGVYGGSVEALSYASLHAPRAARRPTTPGHELTATEASPFLSLRGGMETLVNALMAAIRRQTPPATLRFGSCVEAITLDPAGGYAVRPSGGEAWRARAVIVATPARVAAQLLHALDPALAAPLAAIPHASSLNVNLAYREAPPLPPGHGFLVAGGGEQSSEQLLACTFAHQKFAGRAPQGGALLRLFYGEPSLALSDPQIEVRAQAELRSMLGITAAPAAIWIQRCPRAMPQYTVGHGARLAAIAARLDRYPGLRLAGNAYGGVGVPDCIAGGAAAAATVATCGARANQSSHNANQAWPARCSRS